MGLNQSSLDTNIRRMQKSCFFGIILLCVHYANEEPIGFGGD